MYRLLQYKIFTVAYKKIVVIKLRGLLQRVYIFQRFIIVY